MTRFASKNPRPLLRPPLLAAGVAALLAFPVAGLGTGAVAQGIGSPGLGGIPEAPVGHRQPRPSELPPSVLKEEQGNVPAPAPDASPPAQNNARGRGGANRDSGSGNTGAYGQIPSICTGC
jgi:hypothetical protein